MATLQSFDVDESRRPAASSTRCAARWNSRARLLDQFAKADTKLGDANFDIENARIQDVIKQQKVMMEANIADLIIGLEDATNVFGSEFESMKSLFRLLRSSSVSSPSRRPSACAPSAVRNMSLAGNLQELLAKSDSIVGI